MKPKKQIKRAGYKQPKTRVAPIALTFHQLNWLEWISVAFAAWFLFYPDPYRLVLGILLFLPILGILLNGLSKPSIASLVEITEDKDGDPRYDVADFIDLPAYAILLRVLLDFEFESIYSLIIPGSIATIIIIILLFLTHKRIEASTKNRWWIYISLVFNICLYTYGGTYAANCAYDDSRPQTYETRVLDKHIYSGSKGRRSYKIEVAPWGHHLDKEEIRVSMSEYAAIEIGEAVNVEYKRGLFGIPWYYLDKKRK